MIHMTTADDQAIEPPEQPTTKDLPKPTHGSVISAGRVAGTAVYDLDKREIGIIDDVIVDRQQGPVDYAALSFGGFMGLETRHYPCAGPCCATKAGWKAIR